MLEKRGKERQKRNFFATGFHLTSQENMVNVSLIHNMSLSFSLREESGQKVMMFYLSSMSVM